MAHFRKAFLTVPVLLLVVLVLPLVAQLGSDLTQKAGFTKHDLAYYLDENLVNFIRPGIKAKITTASIAADGTITARVLVTDPKGLPLDKDGVNTPGSLSMSLIAAYIPAGKTYFWTYTTTTLKATINNNPPQIQAANDSGGTWTKNADGDYTYTFKTKAPAGFDTTATHAVGVSARRDLSEFGLEQDEWAQVSNDIFYWVPAGGTPKTRSIVSTAACNNCHDPLYGHGGSRLTVEYCILCHTPQTVNPDTLLTQDMPVLIHKIHMGKNLPSVKAGTPYRIWHRGNWSDFSNVGFPSGTDELKTCTVCHQGAPQASNYLTKPSRAACGACHDDVNFATGDKHLAGPQVSDNMCATCHIPEGELEFDASIKGAHVVATQSRQLPGTVFEILRVDNAGPGKAPTVTFTVKNKAGNLVDITKMNSCNLVLAGPTTDYNGYVSESAKGATLSGSSYIYTFKALLPATAKGSYAVGIEGYTNVTLNAGMVNAQTARDFGFNKVFYFSVDGSPVAPRRTVVTQATCTSCHNTLVFHGGNRVNAEFCLVCHNPGMTDAAVRKAADKPDESINFKTMIHKIHTGEELTTDFTIIGHGASVNNYNEVAYVGDRRNCLKCHVKNSYQLPLPDSAISQVAPRDYINPLPPASGACLSCHTKKSAAAHAAIMTSPVLGESCDACHGTASEASVDKVHAR